MLKPIISLLLLLPLTCFSQSGNGGAAFDDNAKKSTASHINLKDELRKLAKLSDSLNREKPREKIYLQFDKPYYAVGDTIWFKAYLLDATYLAASGEGGILYVDITNDSSRVIQQYKLPVASGLSWGSISLDEKTFSGGTYTIRAYTNWSRNFGDDYFFYRSFYISNSNEKDLLVKTRFGVSTLSGNNMLTAGLLFSSINKIPFAAQSMQIQALSGSKQLFKQKLRTGVDGLLDINFNIPQKALGMAIIAESEQKDKKVVIPVTLNRPENIDLQFLPEGGNLVSGLPAYIGFKAINEDGKGVNVSGVITGRDQKPVAEFKSVHNGIGSFDLPVKAGEVYSAKIILPGGATKEFPLPAIKTSGTVLHVNDPVDRDSLDVSALATPDIVQSGNKYFLIGKSRGIVCYAAVISLSEGAFTKKIAKSAFPTGIAHITLMTTDRQPLNERLVFIDHHDGLHIGFITDKTSYCTKDSIALKIKVTDNIDKPVQGSFSLAVTDDAQVETDTLNNKNVLNHMLLTSELKGFVEEPGYYLSGPGTERWQALDNLLLTQGWVGYDWKDVFNPSAIAYQPEHEMTVKGRVGTMFNRPLKVTHVVLFSKSPLILMDTVTDKNGKFVFDHFPPVDTPVFVIKATNKNGKSFNVGIDMEEQQPPVFTKAAGPPLTPWYVNSDTTLLNYTKKAALIRYQAGIPAGAHLLKEVKISAKKIVKGSQNLNGPGNADVILDEKDLEKAGKKSLLQLLEENISGFGEMNSRLVPRWYYAHFKHVVLLVDGIFLHDVYQPLDFITFKNYLEEHGAEDVKGIEVMSTAKYAIYYASRLGVNMNEYLFVEITSRSGHGPIIGNTPGMYLYKTLPLTWPKKFYKPKYAVKDAARYAPDLRSTIDWEPNIITDANGEAQVSFFSAGSPSVYTIIIEGSDMSGSVGYKLGKIKVVGK